MNEKLYTEQGYVNMEYVMGLKNPFTFVIGGRGTGKTYGALVEILKRKEPFLFLRRTQTQADILSNKDFQPFNIINKDFGTRITTKKINKYVTGFYQYDDEGSPTGEPIGFMASLSTFSSIRGIDFQQVKTLLYDEFIPERHEHKIKSEDTALWNVYETINRNREMNGEQPLKMVALSNANTINNAIFTSLKIVNKVSRMQARGIEIMNFPQKRMTVIDLQRSEVSIKKKQSVLYQLTSDSTEFQSMALDNKFADVPTNVKSLSLKGYDIFLRLGEMYIYTSNSDGTLYVSTHKKGTPKMEYEENDRELKSFKMDYPIIVRSFFDGRLIFENDYLSLKFTNLLNLS